MRLLLPNEALKAGALPAVTACAVRFFPLGIVECGVRIAKPAAAALWVQSAIRNPQSEIGRSGRCWFPPPGTR